MLLNKNKKNSKNYNFRLNNENRYLIVFYESEDSERSFIGDIKGKKIKFGSGYGSTNNELLIKDVQEKEVTITHLCGGVEINYKNIYWVGLLSFLGVSTFRLKQTVKNLNKIVFAYKREKLLEKLMSLKAENHKVSKESLYLCLMNNYEGQGSYKFKREIDWQLEALKGEGLIQLDSNSITINPNVLNELSSFELSDRRHRDSRNLTKAQIFLGCCMLIVVGYNVFFK